MKLTRRERAEVNRLRERVEQAIEEKFMEPVRRQGRRNAREAMARFFKEGAATIVRR